MPLEKQRTVAEVLVFFDVITMSMYKRYIVGTSMHLCSGPLRGQYPLNTSQEKHV